MIVFLVVLVSLIIVLPFAFESRRKVMGPEDRRDAPGEFIELSQGITHYQWHGPVRGPIAVCVHGLTTPSFVWQGLTAGLTAMGYRVLTYDLYGRGYSDRPKGDQTDAFFCVHPNPTSLLLEKHANRICNPQVKPTNWNSIHSVTEKQRRGWFQQFNCHCADVRFVDPMAMGESSR